MDYEEVTEAMAKAGMQIASDLMDANCLKLTSKRGCLKTWGELIECSNIKNKDLVIAHVNGEIDSVTAIYKAMRREVNHYAVLRLCNA